MFRRGLLKCSSLIFIVFLMCPRRIRSTAIGKQDDFHAVRRSKPHIDTNLRAERPFGYGGIIPNDGNFIELPDDEPGFDLNDDEIRKLKLWPKGIIPYYIDTISFNDKVLRDRIRLYLNTVNTQTKLSFLELPSPPKDDKTRWVFFANRRGQLDCADHSILNFTNEGVQHVNLGYDCLSTGGELAEAVLTIAGVPPQHNSPDRDTYVVIMEENIMPEKRYLFRKLNDTEWLFHDIDYDVTSAGHYHHHKYSVNGQATIQFAIEKDRRFVFEIKRMGEINALSRDDLQKLRMLYNYIVKKKKNKVPECAKLFRKGHNFQDVALSTEDIPSRKKPDKYLGLSVFNEIVEDLDKGPQSGQDKFEVPKDSQTSKETDFGNDFEGPPKNENIKADISDENGNAEKLMSKHYYDSDA